MVRDPKSRTPGLSLSHASGTDLFHAAFLHAAVGLAVVDLKGRPIETNPALEEMLGYRAEELRGMTFAEFTHPDDAEVDRTLFQELLQGRRSRYEVEKRYLRADGSILWAKVAISLARDPTGSPRYALGVVEEITERKRVEADLREERARFEQLFENAPEGVVLVDLDERVLRVNGEFQRMFGYTLMEAVGRRLAELIIPEAEWEKSLETTHRIARGEDFRFEAVRRRKDGSRIPVSIIGTPVRVGDEAVAVYGIYRDISERVEAEERLRKMALTDELTGLHNRRGFFILAEQQWRLAKRHDRELAVLFVDLDDFKQINDRFGHEEGDRVLRATAELIRSSFRDSDLLGRVRNENEEELLARMGGDEFVLLAIDTSGDIDRLLERRLKEIFAHYNERSGRDHPLTCSVGAVRARPGEYDSLEDLLREADHRMYASKQSKGRRR